MDPHNEPHPGPGADARVPGFDRGVRPAVRGRTEDGRFNSDPASVDNWRPRPKHRHSHAAEGARPGFYIERINAGRMIIRWSESRGYFSAEPTEHTAFATLADAQASLRDCGWAAYIVEVK